MGLASPLRAGREPLPIVVTLDARGVARSATGPLLDPSAPLLVGTSREVGQAEARAVLNDLDGLGRRGFVTLTVEHHSNSRRRLVTAHIADAGLDYLDRLTVATHAAAGGE